MLARKTCFLALIGIPIAYRKEEGTEEEVCIKQSITLETIDNHKRGREEVDFCNTRRGLVASIIG